jgi:CHAD domain-containing protein
LEQEFGFTCKNEQVSKVKVETPKQAAGFVRQSLAAPFALLQEPQTITSLKSVETVHQLRVALRTLRTLVKAFRKYFVDQAGIDEVEQTLAGLDAAFQSVRDADVMVDWMLTLWTQTQAEPVDALQPLLAEVKAKQIEDRRQLAAALRSAKVKSQLNQISGLIVAGELDSAALANFKNRLATQNLRRYKEIAREMRASGLKKRPATELHALRIQSKEARYLAAVSDGVKGLKLSAEAAEYAKLQDVLGAHNDLSVLSLWLKMSALANSEHEKPVAILQESLEQTQQQQLKQLKKLRSYYKK